MTGFNFTITRVYLQSFNFRKLFIEVLGWSTPADIHNLGFDVGNMHFDAVPISQLAGVVVFEVTASDGVIPNAKERASIHHELSKLYHENLLIFIDKNRTLSLWYWVKREDKRTIPREHLYAASQPGDLFLGKLSAMVVEISELDESGNINVLQVAQRLQNALDVERVTKKFYNDFADQRLQFMELIQGIADDHDRKWYASVLLNRLMFIYFLQKKGFVDNGDLNYLQRNLDDSEQHSKDAFYSGFPAPALL
jgi:hypothetical protein